MRLRSLYIAAERQSRIPVWKIEIMNSNFAEGERELRRLFTIVVPLVIVLSACVSKDTTSNALK